MLDIAFVMTSNAIAGIPNPPTHRPIGFAAQGEPKAASVDNQADAAVVAALRGTFKPEFLSRIDEIAVFSSLNREGLRAIACKMLDELAARVEERDVAVEISDEVAEFICEGVSRQGQGARPMARLIDALVGAPLSDLLVARKLSSDDSVEVAVRNGRVVVTPTKKQR